MKSAAPWVKCAAAIAELRRRPGCQPQITVLSLPVTYASMKNRDIDVFLGN